MSTAERRLRTPAGTGRGNLWLGILAVVQAAALAFVLLTVARPPIEHTGPLLGKNVTTADITAFTVTGSDGSAVTLKRDGVNWVLPDQGGYPAQNSRVKSFLQELTALQRSGLVATTQDAYKRLKVAPDTYQRKIDLTLKGGGKETLYIGSEPSYGSTHVRLAKDKGVYVTHSLHASDARTDASGYVDTTVLKLDQANVKRMEIKNANGDFVFTKGAGGWSWQGLPNGKKLDTQAVTNIVGALTSLQLNEPLGKKVQASYGFDKPRLPPRDRARPGRPPALRAQRGRAPPDPAPTGPARQRARPSPALRRRRPADRPPAARRPARPPRAGPARPPSRRRHPPSPRPGPSPPRPPSPWAPRTRRASTRSACPTRPTSSR
ncbi:MAG: DUF4340 domain-containing protein [Deinococcales bacterium]